MNTMTRKLRHFEQADWYHLYNRGSDRQDIFSLPGDHELFEFLIGEACTATGLEIHAYALMTNHFHLLVFDPDGAIPKFMQVLCGRYALAYNSRTKRTGPLFTGRFGSVPITDDRHLLIEARYVERNPLAIVPARALPSYRHASLGVLLGRRTGPGWLSTDVLLPMISPEDYLAFVVDSHDADLRPPAGCAENDRPGIGDLCRATSNICGVDITEVSGSPRNVALAVAFELRLAGSADLATAIGISAAAVRMAARRGRILTDTDTSMSRTKQRIIDSLCA